MATNHRLFLSLGQLTIEDTGSTNGTFVNGIAAVIYSNAPNWSGDSHTV